MSSNNTVSNLAWQSSASHMLEFFYKIRYDTRRESREKTKERKDFEADLLIALLRCVCFEW